MNQELNGDRFILRSVASLLYAMQIFITIPLTGDEQGPGYKGNFSIVIEMQFSTINRYHRAICLLSVPANFLTEQLLEYSEFSNFL